MADIKSRNKQTAKKYIIDNQAVLEVGLNAKGKHYFICGSKRGYCSPRAAKETELKNLVIAECSNDDGKTWVPTLMLAGGQIIRTFGAELLAGQQRTVATVGEASQV
jgi:hypothetical protein